MPRKRNSMKSEASAHEASPGTSLHRNWAPLGSRFPLRSAVEPRMNRRRLGLLLLQTAFGVFLLAAWLWVVDLQAMSRQLANTQWQWVVLAAGFGLSASLPRVLRWRLVLQPVRRLPALELWLITLTSSLVNFIIPLRTGELARGLLLRQRHELPLAASLPTVAVDRSFDLLAVLAMAGAGLLAGVRSEASFGPALLAASLLLFAFAIFVIGVRRWQQRLLTLFGRALPTALGDGLRGRILTGGSRFLTGLTAAAQRPGRMAAMFGLSLLAFLLDVGMVYCLFLALGATPPPATVSTGYALFTLTFLVPGAPGYVGSLEAFGSLAFTSLGIAPHLAAGAAVLFHAVNALILGLFGGLSAWLLGFQPRLVLGEVSTKGEPETAPQVDRAPVSS